MRVYVLGAPGSGKTTLRPGLAERMPDRVVMDWDDLMESAGQLAGADIRSTPSTWSAYRDLIRSVVEIVGARLVLLGVCAPAELTGWSIDRWLLLDCDDEERRTRLANRPDDIAGALQDAAHYRTLGLETIDSSRLSSASVADLLARTLESPP